MSVWLLRLLHMVGLTNLSDREVDLYIAWKKPQITSFTININVKTRSPSNASRPINLTIAR